MENVKLEINVKTSVKAIINGFVSYGIITFFICSFISFFIQTILPNNNLVINITVPIIECIFLYYIMHALCRLSTFDVFKKCKTNSENIDKISKKMNLFFIVCAILFVLFSILFLYLKLDTLHSQIKISELQYSQVFSENFAQKLTNDMLNDYYKQKNTLIFSNIILELGLVISILSLVPFQKKMLKTYNTI